MNTKTMTATKVEETTAEAQVSTTNDATKNDNTKNISSVVFLVFAEFMGYVSPLVTVAEKACKGSDIPTYLKKVIRIEAKHIFDLMLKTFTLDEIRVWWDRYYDVLLSNYEENVAKQDDDLPF